MSASLTDMLNTFRNATLAYETSGNPALKPAADRAKDAIEQYIGNLNNTVRQRDSQLRNYVDSNTGVPNEVRKLSQKSQEIRQNTNQIAAKYLVASNLTEATPIDWSQYYVKFGVIAGLAGALAIVGFVR
jgi:hypothetical protein